MSFVSTLDRKQTAKDFLVGCALVSLLYIDVWRLLLSANSPYGFFLAYGPWHYVGAIVVTLAGGLLMAAAATLLRSAPSTIKYASRLCFLATTAIIANEVRKSSVKLLPAVLSVLRPVTGVIGRPGMALAVLVSLALVLRFAVPLSERYRQLLLAASVFAAFAMLKAVWILASMDFSTFQVLKRPTHPGLRDAHRVVMVVFDEMDNEIAFTKRSPGLALPNFDSFRLTAVTFDSTYSPGPNTAESMPSYLMGERVDSLIPLSGNAYAARLRNGRRVHSDSVNSIFSEPARLGARTALVGFALPYCRLRLVSMVDECIKLPLVGGGVVNIADETLWSAIGEQIRSLVPFNGRREHIQRLQGAIADAARLAADSTYSLVLIHLPLPHSPWIWDRRANEFRVNIANAEGYEGNLALADRVLGTFRQEMTRRGTWDPTTVIVTADHPWRTKLNEHRSADRRIPLMIKLPGMQQGDHVIAPTNSIVISRMMPDLLAARIPDAATLRQRTVDAAASGAAALTALH